MPPEFNGLEERHLADLRASGLSDPVIASSGIYSANADDVRNLVGFDAGPGMAIPYMGAKAANGRQFCRVKPDKPFPTGDGKLAKYLSPKKPLNPEGNRLYVPPTLDRTVLGDAAVPVIITEGEKKALKAVQEGFVCIGLAGVYSWLKKENDGRSGPIADLFAVNWVGRHVAVVFDSDAAIKPEVQKAERALRDELRRRGARASIVRLPEPTYLEAQGYGPKLGLDDFLCARGPIALKELLSAAASTLPLGARRIGDLLREADVDTPMLIEGVWPETGCGFFAGEPKSKKSFLSLLLAISVASGRSFLGRRVRRGGVVLIDEENDRRELKKRVRRVAAGIGIAPETLDISVAAPSVFKLDDDEALQEFDRLLDEIKPALVILDPLVRLHSGDENDAGSIAPLLGRLRQLSRKHLCAVVIVHHMKKKGEGRSASHGQRMRGSSDLHGWLDSAVYFETAGDAVKLTFECRYAVAPDPIHVRMIDDDDAVRWELADEPVLAAPAPKSSVPADAETVRRALSAAPAPMSKSEIKTATKLSDKRINAALESLKSAPDMRMGIRATGGAPSATFTLATAETSSPPSPPLREEAAKKKKSDAADPGDLLLRRDPPPKGDDGEEEVHVALGDGSES